MAEPSRLAAADAVSPALIGEAALDVPTTFRPTFFRLGKELRTYLGRWGLFFLLYEQVADRDAVVAALKRLPLRIAAVDADGAMHPDWLALEAAIIDAAEFTDAVEVFGLERWLDVRTDDAAQSRLLAFNVRREAFSRRVAVPVLLWLKPAQARDIASTAPDLWSWRAGVHRFVEEVVERTVDRSTRPQVVAVGDIDNRPIEDRRLRIDELVAYLESEAAATEPRFFASLGLELASLYASIGEYDASIKVRQSLRPLLEGEENLALKALNLGGIASVLMRQGQFDEALALLVDEELPIYERLGDVYSTAVTWGSIADILQMRGDLDEALKIRRERELPVFERLGNARARTVTLGKIADILQMRGQLDEALAIRREEQLPVYERLGDLRGKALTMGRIADILEVRGDLDEALRIRREDELPVYRLLGDARSAAVTIGQIADVLVVRGQLDEALAIRVDEELPVYERMGDLHSIAVTRSQIAEIHTMRGQLDEALDLMQNQVLPVYEKLGVVRERALAVGKIADILELRGQLDEAMAIRLKDELPVYERLGDIRSRAATLNKMADVLSVTGRKDEALTLWTEQVLPLMQRIGNPEWIRLVQDRIDAAGRPAGATETESGPTTAPG